MDPIISREEDLQGYFETGSKPRERWGIGLEYERAGVFRDSGRAVAYEGPNSVETILNTLAKNAGWTPIQESGLVLGLSKGDTRITLEPGAQMELSGAVHRSLGPLRDELVAYTTAVEEVSRPHGITWLGIGLQPFTPLDEIGFIPKKRYAIMRDYLPKRGSRAHVMMKQTCGIQINLDYGSETDAADKLRTAMGLSPLLTALFANSPILDGRLNGYMTYRAWAWLDTDPDRCGLLPFVFKDGAGFHDYLEYALDVPMFIEVRGEDSGEPASCLALAAFLKGILYDGASRRAAWGLVRDMSFKERERLLEDVCRAGPAARLPAPAQGRGEGTAGTVPARDLLIELVRLARQGLNNQGCPEESEHLAILDRRLGGEGGCPAARLAADWEGPMGRNPLKLVEALSQTQVEVS